MSQNEETDSYVYNDNYTEMLSWQIDRFQHIQSLSLGFLGISLTILAVLATVYSAIGSPTPHLVSLEGVGETKYVGKLGIVVIVLLGYSLTASLGIGALVTFVVSVWRFLDIVLSRPLFDSTVQSKDYRDVVDSNQDTLEQAQNHLVSAGFRFPVALVFLFVSIQYYVYSVSLELANLAGISLFIAIPSLSKFILKPLGITSSEVDDQDSTLSQEFLADNPENTRIADINLNPIEEKLILFTQYAQILLIAVYLLSVIYTFATTSQVVPL